MTTVTDTTAYLIRHGEVPFPKGPNGEDLIYGEHAQLNQAGEAQMRALGIGLRNKEVRLSAIYTSPFERAHQSAQILGDAFDYHVPIVDDPRLRAKSYPSWVGKPVREAPGGILFSREGDETDEEANARFDEAYQEILRKNKGRTVGIVGHSEQIEAKICQLLGRKIESPKNGEGFRLTITPDGDFFCEPVIVEVAGRNRERI